MITENSLGLLEFNKLLGIISDLASSDASRKSVLGIIPLNKRDDIEERFGQINEIRTMSQEGSPLALSLFPDITHLLLKIRPEGAVLDSRELSDFIPVLTIAFAISLQIKERDDLPFLKELTSCLTGHQDILKILERTIDREGNILDTASPVLSQLRRQIRSLEGRIRKKLEAMVRDERLSAFLQDDFITQRSGRWVIPVRMDSRGHVSGIVHDVSKSGETAFIEPLTIINLSNELENLVAEQKAEEIRILRNICSKIRDVVDEIDAEYKTIVHLDVLKCIARFADMMQMESPQINNSDTINLVKARHPLLMLAFQKMGSTQQVVPLDINLGGNNTVMVITGSNAGGKTIAIKTIGLLLIMALSGVPVPADSSSSFPLANNLLIDIGDEQSIENNLSTFSAHISNISEILKRADSKTVVLIDELGTGTDPDEGAALACAVLSEIRKSSALVFATTHLTTIKGFVHRAEGMLNASMEFDHKTLTPLYRLRLGEPGQSYALEIARRYGISDSVIDSAKSLLGGIKVELDNLIADLNEKRAQYEIALNELQKHKLEIEEKNRKLEMMLFETESSQKELLAKAYQEASDIIFNIKREMHSLLDEIKKKGREKVREVIKEVERRHKEVNKELENLTKDAAGALSIDEITDGDVVFVKSLGYDARVIEVNQRHNRIKVKAGNIDVEVSVTDIFFKRGKVIDVSTDSAKINRQDKSVSSRLNLVGLRVDEALSLLESFLNQASLEGITEVTIIHGIGAGILSKAVREHLDRHPLAKQFRSGTPYEGGSGITFVTMA